MGMYTEYFIRASINAKHKEVCEVLDEIINQRKDVDYIDHPWFTSDRGGGPFFFNCSSYYFVPRAFSMFEYDEIGKFWVLIARADLKNYDNEIEKFFDWILPYVEAYEGEFVGYQLYEEETTPTLYYK